MSRLLDLEYDTRLNMHYPVALVEHAALKNHVNPHRNEWVRGHIDDRNAISGDAIARMRNET